MNRQRRDGLPLLQPNLVKRLIIGEFESDYKNHFQIPQCILNKVKECCLSKISFKICFK